MGRLAASQRRGAKLGTGGGALNGAGTKVGADARAAVEEASDALREAKRRVSLATTTSTFKRLVSAFGALQTLPEAPGLLPTAKQPAERQEALQGQSFAGVSLQEEDQQLISAAMSSTASSSTASPAIAASTNGVSHGEAPVCVQIPDTKQTEQPTRQQTSQPSLAAQPDRRRAQPSAVEQATQHPAAERTQLSDKQPQHGLIASFRR